MPMIGLDMLEPLDGEKFFVPVSPMLFPGFEADQKKLNITSCKPGCYWVSEIITGHSLAL